MPTYEVVLKKVDPKTVAAVRDVIPTYSHVGRLFGEVFAYLGQHGARPTGAPLAIPNREVHLRGPESGEGPANYITEVQFPVGKA